MNSTLNAAMNTTMNMTLFFLVGDFEPEAKPIAGLVVSIVWLCLVVIIPAVLYVRDFRFMRTVDKKPL